MAYGTVEKALFSILCTTCQARLKVRSQKAIGEILGCPKCGSMVQITPPEGWVPPQPPVEAVAAGVAATAGGTAEEASIAGSETADASLESLEGVASEAMPEPAVAPAALQASPAELLWRKWLLMGAAPVVVVVLAVGLWAMFSSGDSPEPETAQQTTEPATPEQDPTPPAEVPEANEPEELSPGLSPPEPADEPDVTAVP